MPQEEEASEDSQRVCTGVPSVSLAARCELCAAPGAQARARMKLRLFRSLVGRQRIPRASSVASARFDGIEISLSQLEDSPSILNECAENSLRVVCLLNGIADASDAEAQLHRLSSQLSSRPPDAVARGASVRKPPASEAA